MSHETVATLRRSTSLASEVFEDMCFDLLDLFAQGFGFLELLFLTVLLEERGVAKPDVLDFASEFIYPFGHVHLVGFPSDLSSLPVWVRLVRG